MKWIFIVFLIIAGNHCSYSQGIQRKNITYSYPSWDTSFFRAVKSQSVIKDSVYYYTKLKNNHDSTLAAVLYFNASGNLVEKDEINVSTKAVISIVNYRYTGDLLTMEETLSKTSVAVNDDAGIQKEVRTFDHDSADNIITEKDYSYRGSSPKPYITAMNREYDSLGHITKEYVTMPGSQPYLYRTYEYLKGVLSEQKIHDMQQQWIYSYVYEYDEPTKTKSVYLVNQARNIRNEFFYDSQQQLIKEKDYGDHNGYWDFATREYTYDSNGLLVTQSVRAANGDSFYFKHFYTKKE